MAPVGHRVVILDLAGGEYVLLSGPASDVWHGLQHADHMAGLLLQVGQHWQGDRAELRPVLEKLLDDLVTRGLVVRA